MNKMKNLFAVLLVVAMVILSVACGKKNKGNKATTQPTPNSQSTPTESVKEPEDEPAVFVESVKGYPENPIDGSEMDLKWKISSYFEEFLFDKNGICTAFEQECVMRSADDYEETKKYLEDAGYHVTWSESHESFRITFDKDDTKFADAKAYFAERNNGCIVRYSDGNTDVIDAPEPVETKDDSDVSLPPVIISED